MRETLREKSKLDTYQLLVEAMSGSDDATPVLSEAVQDIGSTTGDAVTR